MAETKNLIFSNKGVQVLKTLEGFSALPYRDVAGYWTIGYGTWIKQGEYNKITPEKGEELLREAVSHTANAINSYVTVPLTQSQFDALVIFAYNVGIHAFEESTLLVKLNDNKYEEAAQELLKWCHAKGKVVPGLLNRRKTEKLLFEGKL